MVQALTLGSVTFHNFEVPESLPNLFGVQKLAIHDFPSQGQGSRTVQTLGSFPFPDISWTGIFFDNDAFISSQTTQTSIPASAIERASQLNTYRVQGTSQQLVWGPFQYQVIIAEFEVIGRLQQELEYRIKLVPVLDKTPTSNTSPTTVSPNAAVLSANTGVMNASTSTLGLLLPTAITSAAALIESNVVFALLAVNNNVGDLSSANINSLQAQVAALQLLLNPIANGSDYGQASAATVLSASLSTLSTTLNIGQSVPVTTITVTNPNLLTLASQYYGDSSLWPLIAAVNNLQDQNPVGTFTLIIPPSTTQSDLIPS